MNNENILDTIANALQLQGLPKEEQETLLLEFSALIFRDALITMLERMDEPTKERFAALANEKVSEDEFKAFLQEHVPDADAIIRHSVDEMVGDILVATSS